MQFHVGRFEIQPNHVRHVWYRQQLLLICCLPPGSFALVYSQTYKASHIWRESPAFFLNFTQGFISSRTLFFVSVTHHTFL